MNGATFRTYIFIEGNLKVTCFVTLVSIMFRHVLCVYGRYTDTLTFFFLFPVTLLAS